MFKIGKLFHLTHVVDDLDAVDRWYDDVFAVTRFYHGYEKLAGRDASLVAIGDVIMEPMTPARVEPLRNLSVKKFHDRFGQHFHSIAWYVDDVEAISARLDQERLRLYNIVGSQVKPPHKMTAIWTHPKETYGQLEFALVSDFTKDPRFEPAWSNAPWREHPLGIERASHIGVVVRDLPAAKRLYCDVLGGALIHEEETPGRKRSAFVAVGEDTVVELIQPSSSTSREGRDLEKNGDGIHSLIFKTHNLERARDFLRAKNLQPEAEGADSIVLGPEQAFGMVIGFTQRTLPNDPR
ncbi:MAG TPA: VOC family protein [Methylomirabilota bacterium]|jgi:catechol 2,3-dioxygenase-like lactoylglutathione lyase family enzyme|nr:VOC family protein [Methylomirabilota bacterium]